MTSGPRTLDVAFGGAMEAPASHTLDRDLLERAIALVPRAAERGAPAGA